MGYRGKIRRPDTEQGQWSWNEASFREKYDDTNKLDCWIWQGSAGPHSALFGAYKNGRAQMTQARRISWMQHTHMDCEDLALRMTCHNKMCVNPLHMEPEPNRRRYDKN